MCGQSIETIKIIVCDTLRGKYQGVLVSFVKNDEIRPSIIFGMTRGKN